MDRIEETRIRWEAEKERGKSYLSLSEELADEFFKEVASKDKHIILLEAVVDAAKGLFGGDGRLATSETCRNCVNTMARMLKVGDALAALGKEGS